MLSTWPPRDGGKPGLVRATGPTRSRAISNGTRRRRPPGQCRSSEPAKALWHRPAFGVDVIGGGRPARTEHPSTGVALGAEIAADRQARLYSAASPGAGGERLSGSVARIERHTQRQAS